jgi:hypothetical protein
MRAFFYILIFTLSCNFRSIFLIELTDPKWSGLNGNYGSGCLVAELIAKAEAGAPMNEWYEELFQGLCHQETVSEAAYAAAPHLVKIAASPGAPRKDILILLGACYTNSDFNIPIDSEEDWHAPTRKATMLSSETEEEWRASARRAIPLLAELLTEPQPELDLRYLLSCMAAFHGYQWLAKILETLDVIMDGEA